jgi:hypothetical protein
MKHISLSSEAFYARNEQSQKEIKAGALISHKEVKKKIGQRNKRKTSSRVQK